MGAGEISARAPCSGTGMHCGPGKLASPPTHSMLSSLKGEQIKLAANLRKVSKGCTDESTKVGVKLVTHLVAHSSCNLLCNSYNLMYGAWYMEFAPSWSVFNTFLFTSTNNNTQPSIFLILISKYVKRQITSMKAIESDIVFAKEHDNFPSIVELVSGGKMI